MEELNNLKENADKLRRVLEDMERMEREGNEKRYSILSMDAAMRGERLAVELRGALRLWSPRPPEETLLLSAGALDIKVSYEEGVFRAVLPRQLPRRRDKNSAFLTQPLTAALSALAKEKKLPLLKEAAVCFDHIYEFDTPTSRMRDYDNLECKQILDVLAPFLLVDDNPLFCDVSHHFEWGPKTRTEVFILERAAYPAWLFGREMGGKPCPK